jgi:hypothetical protein
VTLREEHRLRVFENRVLRRIFGPKRDEVTGEWRKLQNKKLHDLYSSPSIIRIIKSRMMRWEEAWSTIGREIQKERDHQEEQDVGGWIILGWILQRWDGVMWTCLAQDRDRWRALVNSVLNLRVP